MDQSLRGDTPLNYSQIFSHQGTGQLSIKPLVRQQTNIEFPSENYDEPQYDINRNEKNKNNQLRLDWYSELAKQNTQYCQDLGRNNTCLCKTVGWNLLCTPGHLDEKMRILGIGVNLYFRFLNSFILLSFFITLISAVMVVVNIFCYIESGQKFSRRDPSLVLASTTIGFIPLSGSACQIKVYEEQIDVQLSCKTGVLDFKNGLRYGYVYEEINQNCWVLSESKISEQSYNLKQYNEECDSKQNCSLTLYNQSKPAVKYLYMSVICKDASTKMFGSQVLNAKIPLILGYSDALICLIIIIYLLNLQITERLFRKKLKSVQPQLEQFTLQITDLLMDQSEDTLIAQLKDHFQKIMSDKNVVIYDIQVSQGLRFINQQKKIQQCLVEIDNKIQSLGQHLHNDSDYQILKIKQSQIEPYIKQTSIYSSNSSIQNEINQLRGLNNQKAQLQSELQYIRDNQQNKFIWITFQKMTDKLATQIDFTPGCIDYIKDCCCCDCFCDCCCNKYKVTDFQNKKIYIKQAPNPDNIIWENLNYTKANRRLRRYFSYILTIGAIISAWFAIAYFNASFTQIENIFPDVDCVIFGIEDNEIDEYIQRYEKKENVKNQIICYCTAHFIDVASFRLNQKIQKACNEQMITIIVSTSLPYISSFVIIVLNIIIDKIFIPITKFEKHQNLTEEQISLTFKSFFAEFTNSALIILFQKGFFQFDASKIDWYLNTGLTVIWTLALNIVSVPVALLFDRMIYKLKKRYDKGLFVKVENSSKSSTLHEFLRKHKGQEFSLDQKYSKIMSSNLICFMYAPALPLLYSLNLLTMLIIYWIDKAGLFRFYQQPPRYDKSLSVFMRKFLWFGLIIHCLFSLYFYGNPSIFREVVKIDDIIPSAKINSFLRDYLDRAYRQPQLLGILAILLIVLIFYFLINFIIRPFFQFIDCISSKLQNKYNQWQKSIQNDGSSNYNKRLEEFLNFGQLQQEIGVLKFVYPQRKNLFSEKFHSFKQLRNNFWMKLHQVSKEKINVRQNLDVEELQKLKPQKQLLGLTSYDIMQNPKLKSYFKAEWDMLYQSNYV